MSTRKLPGFNGARGSRPTTDVAIANAGLRSPGAPLDAKVRASVEPLLGSDFSNVRVHTDADAAASAQALGAAAYAAGNDIAFGAGRYRPESRDGQRLLAHELAHVAQPRVATRDGIAPADHPSEREADQVPDTIVAGGRATPSIAAGGAIQREPLPGMDILPPLRGSEGLLDDAPPFLASAVGSTTLEGFDPGSAVLTPAHTTQLASTAKNIVVLLRQYNVSTITIVGYGDGAAHAAGGSLGEMRAIAAKQALMNAGIAESIISVSEGSQDQGSSRSGAVEVRFHPKRLDLPGLMPKLQFPGPVSPNELPGFYKKPPSLNLDVNDLLGLKKYPIFTMPKPGPWLNTPPTTLLPMQPQQQAPASALPSIDLDFKIGPVTIKVPKEVRANLPIPLSRSKSIEIEMGYEVPAKFSFKIALDGTSHVKVGFKLGAEIDVKKGGTTGSAALVIESTGKICHGTSNLTLKQKLEATGEKLNKAAKEYSALTDPSERIPKAIEIGGYIGEMYGEVEKAKAGCKSVSRWSFEFGVKGPIGGEKKLDPGELPPASTIGPSLIWRF